MTSVLWLSHINFLTVCKYVGHFLEPSSLKRNLSVGISEGQGLQYTITVYTPPILHITKCRYTTIFMQLQ